MLMLRSRRSAPTWGSGRLRRCAWAKARERVRRASATVRAGAGAGRRSAAGRSRVASCAGSGWNRDGGMAGGGSVRVGHWAGASPAAHAGPAGRRSVGSVGACRRRRGSVTTGASEKVNLTRRSGSAFERATRWQGGSRAAIEPGWRDSARMGGFRCSWQCGGGGPMGGRGTKVSRESLVARPVGKSSRMDKGVIPLFFLLFVIATRTKLLYSDLQPSVWTGRQMWCLLSMCTMSV
jgi:hypothetical protein